MSIIIGLVSIILLAVTFGAVAYMFGMMLGLLFAVSSLTVIDARARAAGVATFIGSIPILFFLFWKAVFG